ncbi:TPA: hypothetical protein ACH3X2_14307 [Trebouxia sp. C0005]
MGTSLLCRQCVRCTQPFLPAYGSCRTSRPVHQPRQTLQPQPQQVQFAHNQTLDDEASHPQQCRKVLKYSRAAQTEAERRRKSACQQHIRKQVASVLALVPAACLLQASPALALRIHQEPDNALSFPTWVIHISSVIEWGIAMALVWKYAEVTGNSKWKGLTWGMMPLLGGALCACTYHFYYNSPDLDFLVAVQASLTWIGNATCAAAAYRIYKSSEQEGAA